MSVEGDYKIKSIYSLEQLEDSNLISMLYHLNNPHVNILRRDLSTGMFDTEGCEVFENDKVLTKSGVCNYVRRKPGGFYLEGDPLCNYTITKVIHVI